MGKDMSYNAIEDKSFKFAIRIVNLHKYLKNAKNEFIMSKQLIRSGTSIGANIAEAEKAQTTADFYTKLTIALKEANETHYWLRLLHATDYLSDEEFKSIEVESAELIALLVSITKSLKDQI